MQYSTLLALLSAPLLALAQSDANSFQIPDEGLSASGGEPLTLQWEPTTEGTVTLVLRSGSSNDLNEGTVIASSLENSGSYTWTPSNDLTRGSDYTVEIVDDDDPSNVNYTPYFVLDTDTTVAQQTSIVSLGQPTTTPDLSTASPTGAASTLTDLSTATSGTTMTTTGSSPDSTMMSSASGASNTAESAASSAASTASEAAGSASASTSEDLNAPQQSDNAGSKKTAMVGVLGALALGAAAL